MNILPLHGTTGVWDEVACLVVPATAILGVALAVLRQRPAQDDGAEAAPGEQGEPAPAGDVAGAASETGVNRP